MHTVREPALQLRQVDGNPSTQLEYIKHQQANDGNVITTTIDLKDPKYAIDVKLTFKAYQKENVIETWSTLTNKEKKAITIENIASAALQLKSDKYYLQHFYGDWINEMRNEEVQLPQGIHRIESKLGTRATNFDLPSFLLSVDKPASENEGTVIAGTLAWSGNFKLTFENVKYSEDFGHLLQILPGINNYSSAYNLAAGKEFKTPTFIYTFTTKGKGQASRNLHKWALDYGIYKGRKKRSTLLNNWEATYFDFDEQKLDHMFGDVKKLGVDLFLLDDGWFGNKYPRNNDHTSLGDWDPNKQKLPNGIGHLVKLAHEKGVKFGIWVEPEMISQKSELYEKHPDWVLKLPNRHIDERRQQLVHDLTNPKVQDYVYSVIDKIMQDGKEIAYIKWDCNRYMTNQYSPYLKDNQNNLFVDYVNGLYSVLERFRNKYPDLEMMWCSGGGGRAEYGGLKYFQEFWPSDNTDGLRRVYLQYAYSYFFPFAAQCAHVTSWGKQPIKFRTDVAMSGKLGFDIELEKMSGDELKYCQDAVKNFNRLQTVIAQGEIFRLISPYQNNYAAWMTVSEDKSKAVLFNYNLNTLTGDVFNKIILKGLDPNKRYTIKEINLMPNQKPQFKRNEQAFSGDYLMKVGLDWYLNGSIKSSVLEITSN
ncbi:alpha-galactosidase [Sphingobacterium sp. SGL-16]|uniref:alpha-galactosidase n=1 Tax=Sphingobacterium sp. SGL-16 TaxID=2710883 RepID=UPI0019D0C117|nr:alpha-galactosidase [Sphingobacterium sp. SGL-16]